MNLEAMTQSKDIQPDPVLLPRLSESWNELNEGNGSFQGIDLLPGWMITDVENLEEVQRKKNKKYTWSARFLLYFNWRNENIFPITIYICS